MALMPATAAYNPRVVWLTSIRLPNGSALSCEPQRLRGSPEAPRFQRQTLPEVDWSMLWLVSCSASLGGGLLHHLHENLCMPSTVDDDLDAILSNRTSGVEVEAEWPNAIDS